ncbi:hypothetical protein CPB84DRAFT_1964014 [Gymnopilus junonius]|uniref:C2H2-type domain-containing protein n=1 Tax=Gymnopilus junonius TaxID=109634 RepID=A0A9P5NJR9_GYMJU|nr:hypothetical protein CPB84DRAFT_1964014 [Gymnopilus junonius]
MDIGMLFDMENLDGGASYSNNDLAALLSDSSPVSRAHSSPRNVRTHLRSIPSFNDPGPTFWPEATSPLSRTSWPSQNDLHDTSPLRNARSTHAIRPGSSNVPLVQYSSSPLRGQPASRIAYTPQTANPPISPTREDISWQMYISSSLSLEFCDTQPSAPRPAGDNTRRRIPDSLSFPFVSLPSSGSSDSPPTTINPALFLQLAPQTSPSHPTSQTAHSIPQQGSASSPWANGPAQPPSHVPAILPDGTYAMPIARSMSINTSPLRSATISAASPTSSPLRDSPLPIAQPKPSPARSGQGLLGWSDADLLQVPSPTRRPKRQRSLSSISPIAGAKRPAKLCPLSSTTASEATASTRSSKRARRSASLRLEHPFEFDLDDDDGLDADGDSDDYRPSRSASPDPTYSSLDHAGFSCDGGSKPLALPRKTTKRNNGKAKGSAALALALITQMGNKSSSGSDLPDDLGVDVENALALYQEGRIGIRKRKNHPIPLPVPVPNLNKKSRGRKVPYVAELSGSASPSINARSGSSGAKDDDAFGFGMNSNARSESLSGRGSRRRSTGSSRSTPVPEDGSGSRSFVCVVPGCGKCFVRGEHLKRHVRCIHTNDKPHPCPYEGCDKSFSRRDNLGQHVRIHLQP